MRLHSPIGGYSPPVPLWGRNGVCPAATTAVHMCTVCRQRINVCVCGGVCVCARAGARPRPGRWFATLGVGRRGAGTPAASGHRGLAPHRPACAGRVRLFTACLQCCSGMCTFSPPTNTCSRVRRCETARRPRRRPPVHPHIVLRCAGARRCRRPAATQGKGQSYSAKSPSNLRISPSFLLPSCSPSAPRSPRTPCPPRNLSPENARPRTAPPARRVQAFSR